MKVLLIAPPFERFQGIKRGFFPLGLAYIAAYLRQEGHTVLIYDGDHDSNAAIVPYAKAAQHYDRYLQGLANPNHPLWKEASEQINKFQPQVVGISCTTVKYEAALKIAAICKEISPQITVVLGGCHPTVLPNTVIKEPVVDFAIRQEGELTFAELLEAVVGKKGLHTIPGLSFKEKGFVHHNPARDNIAKLDRLPFPARELLVDASGYAAEDLGLLMGSRGCPYQCTYCASNNMWGRRVRFRSADNIIAEIKSVMAAYGTRQYSFEDDSFTANAKLVTEFAEKVIKERLGIKWSAITRLNLLTPELITKMKAGGCNHLRVGIESGSERVLKATKKKLTVADIEKGAKLLRRSGVYWSAYFMIGLPMETEADIMATIALMKRVKPNYCTLSIFTPYPGTEIFNQLLAEGVVSLDMNWSKFSHASPHNNFARQIKPERFRELLDYAATEIDRHNGSFWRLLKRARGKFGVYVSSPKELIADIRNYLSWQKEKAF